MAKATKTKAITAKHIQSILVDTSMFAKTLLATIEGHQMLKATSMVCCGVSGDYWQQPANKLLQKYKVVEIDNNGWLKCEPYPDNQVDCFYTTPGVLAGDPASFSLVGQWGERQSDGSFLQFGTIGDAICRSQSDPTDLWIVKRSLFDSTYDILVP